MNGLVRAQFVTYLLRDFLIRGAVKFRMADQLFPRLREHRRVGPDGELRSYFYWDARGRGIPDVSLGSERAKAIEGWRKCEQGIFPQKKTKVAEQAARARKLSAVPKVLHLPRPGKRRDLGAFDWSEYPSWLRSMFFNAERRALAAGRPFTINPAALLAIAARANGRCEVSGIAFDHSGDRAPFAPSLDRIECSRGYEPDNVRLVCHIVNVAMNTWGEAPLRVLAEHLCGIAAEPVTERFLKP